MSILEKVRGRWKYFLEPYTLERERKSGFVGNIPILVVFRGVALVATILGLAFRAMPPGTFSDVVPLIVVPVMLMALAAAGSLIVTKSDLLRHRQECHIALIVLDIAVLTWLISTVGIDNSLLFLLYSLPILTASEHLWGRGAIVTTGAVSLAFGSVVYSTREIPGRILTFLTGEIFFFTVLVVSVFLIQLSSQLGRRVRDLLGAIRDMNLATEKARDAYEQLPKMLEEVIEEGFEFAAISIVDPGRQMIEMTHGRNIPPGWLTRSKRPIDGGEILADVYRLRRWQTPAHDDERFEKTTYNLFRHQEIARAYVPVMAEDIVVGIIQCGWDRLKTGINLVPEHRIPPLERIAEKWAVTVSESRSFIFVERLAQSAATVFGEGAVAGVFLAERQLGGNLQFLLKGLAASGIMSGRGNSGMASSQNVGTARPLLEPDAKIKSKVWSDGARAVYAHDNPSFVAEAHRELYDAGVRAFAAIPFEPISDVRGMLMVFYPGPTRISEALLGLLSVLARHIEYSVHYHFLLRESASYSARAWSQIRLKTVDDAIERNEDLRTVLQRVAETFVYNFGADVVMLYRYDEERKTFIAPPAYYGKLEEEGAVCTQVRPRASFFELIKGTSLFESDVAKQDLLNGRFTRSEGIRSCAVLVLRTSDPEQVQGVAFVNYRSSKQFTPEERTALLALASSAAFGLRTAISRAAVGGVLKKRNAELEGIRDIDARIGSCRPREERHPEDPTDLNEILDIVVRKAKDLTGADSAWILWHLEESKALEWRASTLDRSGLGLRCQSVEVGLVGLAVRQGRTVTVGDVHEPEWRAHYKETIPETQSEIAVPVFDGERLICVINLESKELRYFQYEHQLLLEIFGRQIVIAARSFGFVDRIERQIKPLRTLAAVAGRLGSLGYDLDTSLRAILTGVTAGQGVGFTRAGILLVDLVKGELKGRVAVGPATLGEWNAQIPTLMAKQSELGDKGYFEWLLAQSADRSRQVDQGSRTDLPFSDFIKTMTVPLPSGAQIRSSAEFDDGNNAHFLAPIVRQLRQRDPESATSYAYARLTASGTIHGVLVADKSFRELDRIDPADLPLLEMYAELAGIAIQNSILRPPASPEERQSRWQLFAAFAIHRIGTRLNIIDTAVSDWMSSAGEDGQAVGAALREQVAVAYSVLRSINPFVPVDDVPNDPVNIIPLLDVVAHQMKRSRVRLEVAAHEPLFVKGNQTTLKDAFTELVMNALDVVADKPGGVVELRARRGTDGDGRAVAVINVVDNGGGIRPQDQDKIWDRGWSTKPGPPRGDGLAFVRSTVTSFGGSIRLMEGGSDLGGACFTVELPLLK